MLHHIDIKNFLISGELSPLVLEMRKSQAVDVMGLPTSWEPKKRSYKVAHTWDYFQDSSGILSITFGQSTSEIDSVIEQKIIHLSLRVPSKGYMPFPSPFQINNDFLHSETAFDDFIRYLKVQNMSFSELASYMDGSGATLYIEEKSVVTFDETLRLYSLSTYSELAKAVRGKLPKRK